MIVAAVLVKGFEAAKQRLAGALDAGQRRRLAEDGADLALKAAAVADEVAVVAGTAEVASWTDAWVRAAAAGAGPSQAAGTHIHVIVEAKAGGQNAAAERAIQWAIDRGAEALLVISSDLPLVTPAAISEMIGAASRLPGPLVAAAPATGRGGTNALFLRPPDAIGLHFGDDSLVRFEADARRRGIRFLLHESAELALDLDEPDDLARLPHPLGV